MSVDPDDKNNGNSFEYRLKEVSDEEIISILRFRNHYQRHAVNAAIKEAFKRGIISTIEDLDNDEFKPQPLAPKSVFPLGNTPLQTIAIFKSLCRIMYGFGLLPFIYGTYQIFDHRILAGSIFIVIGIIVIVITNRLEKTQKQVLAQLLVTFNIPAIGFAYYKLIEMGKPTIMDIAAASIVILCILYTTLYASKLTTHLNKPE